VALQLRLPVVVTLHCMWGPAARAGYRAADRVVGWSGQPVVWSAVSSAAARPLRDVLGAGSAVVVVPNGIEPADWRVDPVPRDPADVRLVAVMRLAARKRPLPLLRALARARRRLDPAVTLSLTVAGDGPARGRMQRYVHRHGLGEVVRLPGRLAPERVRDLYRRADAFVAPADLESFGIAALEARCAGVPVVAKSGTGIAEFVAHGRHGLLADDDPALADALVELALRPDLRARLAGHSRSEPPPVAWSDVLARCEAAYGSARRLAGQG
jgi:glycosyltransferase involved in cell wall biosynthesis